MSTTWAYHRWPELHTSAFETALALIEGRGGTVLRALDTPDGIWADLEIEGKHYRLSVVRTFGESDGEAP